MYTAYIGKRLIELVNQREGKARTAKEFFDEVYVPLFFMNERYLQHVNNSKFDQAYKQKKKTPLTSETLANALAGQHEKILSDAPDGSFFLGGAAAEASAGTSGQVSDLALPTTEHDVYASWVGAALGVGVSGGLNILIDSNEVLLALFDGWYRYREYMAQTPNLKPHQVNTWNGYWITNVFDGFFDPTYPFANRIPDIRTDPSTGAASIGTTSWIKVIFALSEKMPKRSVNTYVYSLSQMNTTIGFVSMELPAVRYLNELYRKISRERGVLSTDSLDTLYDTALGFQKACELGKIGIPALEPKQLREYMPGGSGSNKSFKPPKDQDDPIIITYTIYQTWIIAMLNNQQLIDLTTKVAATLHGFSSQGDRGKKVNSSAVDKLLESKNRREFIEKLADFVESDKVNVDTFDELANTVTLMPTTDIPLFMALLKLKYAVAKSK
mgnify:CR=1 FL=1